MNIWNLLILIHMAAVAIAGLTAGFILTFAC